MKEPLPRNERSYYYLPMGKGEETRLSILDKALSSATTMGLEGLSIGSLAAETGMSKSGLFAHFQSKEALQIQVLEHGATRLTDKVLRPALGVARGEPRIRALFDAWFVWLGSGNLPGGCPFIAAATELDDRDGPVRDTLVRLEKQQIDFLARAAEIAVKERHFRPDLDCDQFAYELYSVFLGHHHFSRMMRCVNAAERAMVAFESLLERSRSSEYQPPSRQQASAHQLA